MNAYLKAMEALAGYRDAYHALAEYEKGRYLVQQAAQASE